MDILLMTVWFITAPILVWSRYNGQAWLFNVILVINVLSGFFVMIKDVTE